jgi:lipoate-protein ligase A
MGAVSGRAVPHCLTASTAKAGWRVERSTGSAADLLAPWPRAEHQGGPVVRAGRMTGRPALVLGSTQDRAVDDERAAAAGADVLRRSTGGGAVLVAPDAQVWLDVWVPRGHDLWDDDIVSASGWLGDTWAAALGSLGTGALRVHRAPATRAVWSDLICFAGLGPGEVFVAGAAETVTGKTGPTKLVGAKVAGAKVMGLAQRRARAGARFHTSAPLVWNAEALLQLLDVADAVDAGAALADVAVGLRVVVPWSPDIAAVDAIAAVEDAVIAALP